MTQLNIALIGAGAIARAHLNAARASRDLRITSVADPAPVSKSMADEYGLRWFSDHQALMRSERLDGVIVATPNALHAPVAMDFINSRIPVLVEKPIADSVAEGRRLAGAADAAGVPLLVGHQRRHSPIVRRAKEIIDRGELGRLAAVNVLATFLKPDSYFEVAWRKTSGGGPILINLVHELDLLRYLCGEISTVQAASSSAMRKFEVEDSASVILGFSNGALGSICLSDAATAPWSWDQASGENLDLFPTHVESHFICGAEGSLTLPRLNLWKQPYPRGWNHPVSATQIPPSQGDPYQEQLRHFAEVIRGAEKPLVSGADAVRTLEAVEAVHASAIEGKQVTLTAGQGFNPGRVASEGIAAPPNSAHRL